MSQHHRKLDGWRWAKVRGSVLARAGGMCEIRTQSVCTSVATQVDHVVELSKGCVDPYDERLLRAACRPCNNHRNRKIPPSDNHLIW